MKLHEITDMGMPEYIMLHDGYFMQKRGDWTWHTLFYGVRRLVDEDEEFAYCRINHGRYPNGTMTTEWDFWLKDVSAPEIKSLRDVPPEKDTVTDFKAWVWKQLQLEGIA